MYTFAILAAAFAGFSSAAPASYIRAGAVGPTAVIAVLHVGFGAVVPTGVVAANELSHVGFGAVIPTAVVTKEESAVTTLEASVTLATLYDAQGAVATVTVVAIPTDYIVHSGFGIPVDPTTFRRITVLAAVETPRVGFGAVVPGAQE